MLLLLSALLLHAGGGNPQSIVERPYQVAIYREKEERTHWCGGSIISKRSVLTTAHCIQGTIPKEMWIRAGSPDLSNDTGVHWYNSQALIPHRKHSRDKTGWSYDIGLIITTDKFVFGPTIQAIPLSVIPVPSFLSVELTGFGEVFPGGLNEGSILVGRTLTAQDPDFCAMEAAALQPLLPKLTKTQLCTFDPNKDGGCIITTGGPVTICDLLVGVVSWGLGCLRENVTIFYVEISAFNEWIYDNSKEFIL